MRFIASSAIASSAALCSCCGGKYPAVRQRFSRSRFFVSFVSAFLASRIPRFSLIPGSGRTHRLHEAAFQVTEGERITRADGAVMHAEVRIGDSMVMLGEAMDGKQGPLPGMIYLYADDADATYQRASQVIPKTLVPKPRLSCLLR